MVTINQLAEIIMSIAKKKIRLKHIDGPLGVRGRNSDNTLIKQKLNWEPNQPLREGLTKSYTWIAEQVKNRQLIGK
jgi:nucleoside-diphosphate-sugar epimerase